MKNLFFAYALVWPVLSFASGKIGTIPEPWATYLKMDLEFTTRSEWATRKLDESAVVTVFELRVPKRFVKLMQSAYVSPEELNLINATDEFVSLYVVDHPDIPNAKWLLSQFLVVNKLSGILVTSKSTYFVWDSARPTAAPFFIKTSVKYPAAKSGIANERLGNENSVLTSEALERVLQLQGKPDLLEIFNERIAVSFDDGQHQYSFVTRTIPSSILHLGDDEVILPLHGIDGFNKVINADSKPTWVGYEFLPKFAKLTGDLVFRKGFYLENHTQNVSVVLSKKDGKIKKIVLKDFADGMVDVFNQALNNVPLAAYTHRRPMGVINSHLHLSDTNKRSVEAGFYIANFSGQSVLDTAKRHARWNTAQFLKAFAEHSPLCSLSTISDCHQRWMEKLERGKNPYFPIPFVFADYYSGEFGALGMIAQEVISQSNEKLFREKLANLEQDFAVSSQAKMAEYFAAAQQAGSVAWFSVQAAKAHRAAPAVATYVYDGQGLFAFHLWEQKPIGYAYGLSDEALAKLNALFPKTQQKFQCTQFFQPVSLQ